MNKRLKLIKEYIDEKTGYYSEYCPDFLEEMELKKGKIKDVLTGEWSWDINGPAEELAYDIGYVEGLRASLAVK